MLHNITQMITRQTGLEYSYTTTMAMAITMAIFLFAISRVPANGQPAKSERMKAGAGVESRPLDLYSYRFRVACALYHPFINPLSEQLRTLWLDKDIRESLRCLVELSTV